MIDPGLQRRLRTADRHSDDYCKKQLDIIGETPDKSGPRRRYFMRAMAATGLAAVAAVMSGRLDYGQAPRAYAEAPSGIATDFVDFADINTGLLPVSGRTWREGRTLVYSPDGSVVRYISSEQPASYIIFTDADGQVSAKNGLTGKVDYSGSAAGPVIQDAINALPSYTSGSGATVRRGTIYITAGDFIVNGLKIPGDYIEIIGVALRTRITLTDSIKIGKRTVTDTTVKICNLTLVPQDNYPAIKTEVSSTELAPAIILRDLVCEKGGTDPSVYAIRITNNDTHNTELTNIYVNSGQSGILLEGTHQSIQTGNASLRNIHVDVPVNGVGLELRNSILSTVVGAYVGGGNAGTVGLLLNALTNDVFENKFYNVVIEGVDTCIKGTTLSGFSVGHNDFFGGFLYPNSAGYGIYLSGLSNRNSFYSIKIDKKSASSIYETQDDMLNYYERCRVDASVKLSFSSIAKYVMGYVTENYGTAKFKGNGSTTSFTMPHGLVSTPSTYYVQNANDTSSVIKYVEADSIKLTVHFSAAPSAGNDVVLKWRAEV